MELLKDILAVYGAICAVALSVGVLQLWRSRDAYLTDDEFTSTPEWDDDLGLS